MIRYWLFFTRITRPIFLRHDTLAKNECSIFEILLKMDFPQLQFFSKLTKNVKVKYPKKVSAKKNDFSQFEMLQKMDLPSFEIAKKWLIWRRVTLKNYFLFTFCQFSSFKK